MTTINLYYRDILDLGIGTSGVYMGIFAFVFTLKSTRILSITMISVANAVGITVENEKVSVFSVLLTLTS